ncbi:MAG: threonine/serine exporter [Ruminococcaceae bacterium]|nr:threonine/serine exporter [Oscillospiraceae bacterium]
MTQTEIIQILAGFVGTTGFAILFNIRGKRLLTVAIGALLSWLLFVVISKFVTNEPIVYFIVACVISTYAEIMARVLKTPTTTFITTSLIPLIPGGSLYYTMVLAFQGNVNTFLPKAIYTMQLASALALGIIISTTIAKLITGKKNKV